MRIYTIRKRGKTEVGRMAGGGSPGGLFLCHGERGNLVDGENRNGGAQGRHFSTRGLTEPGGEKGGEDGEFIRERDRLQLALETRRTARKRSMAANGRSRRMMGVGAYKSEEN